MTMLNPCDLEIVTGGVLDNDYIDYLTRVMFYAKRADKTLDQVLFASFWHRPWESIFYK